MNRQSRPSAVVRSRWLDDSARLGAAGRFAKASGGGRQDRPFNLCRAVWPQCPRSCRTPCCRCRRTTCRPSPRLCLLSAAALWWYRPIPDIRVVAISTRKLEADAAMSQGRISLITGRFRDFRLSLSVSVLDRASPRFGRSPSCLRPLRDSNLQMSLESSGQRQPVMQTAGPGS